MHCTVSTVCMGAEAGPLFTLFTEHWNLEDDAPDRNKGALYLFEKKKKKKILRRI